MHIKLWMEDVAWLASLRSKYGVCDVQVHVHKSVLRLNQNFFCLLWIVGDRKQKILNIKLGWTLVSPWISFTYNTCSHLTQTCRHTYSGTCTCKNSCLKNICLLFGSFRIWIYVFCCKKRLFRKQSSIKWHCWYSTCMCRCSCCVLDILSSCDV